jgi:hypothetical protein
MISITTDGMVIRAPSALPAGLADGVADLALVSYAEAAADKPVGQAHGMSRTLPVFWRPRIRR